ncbi:MAG: efflux RND transporter permease subunit [Hyphomicrobium sp.]
MISRLIAWSARNAVLVIMVVAIAAAMGSWAVRTLPLDAIPELSDTQVIVYTEFAGQAPQVVEDQVTFPLTTALLTVPKSKVVRGLSFFGASIIYVIFEDGTDTYWARSRVLESLSTQASRMPPGVAPTLGPDSSSTGWVYQYAVLGKGLSLAGLRSLQDWDVRFELSKAAGVSDVASVGGFVKQYSIVVDPNRMRSLGISLESVRQAVAQSNQETGGRTVELSEHEFMVRGRGYLRGIADLEGIVIKAERGTPVLLKDLARIELTGDERRGLAELNGEGEVAGGIVMQRPGSNALAVIDNVKDRINEISPVLPAGSKIVPVYDRSDLIHRAISTLRSVLFEECLIVTLVCLAFLLHVRSALVAILVLPVAMLISFLGMKAIGMGFDIMSLGGIAIAVGAMIDAAIVMIENAHKHLERAPKDKPRLETLLESACEVGPPLFFSLLIITVSFLPVFTLESQEGRLFSPLALTKTFAMASAAMLSVTLVPALMMIFIRGKVVPEHKNPLNRAITAVYRPVIRTVLRFKFTTIVLAIAVLAATVWPMKRLGGEFMPDLDEGTLLYMPTTLPGLSVTKAAELLQTQDRIIRSFPEVESVFGKAGRAQTATDPAPMEMFETLINLKPKSAWRPGLTKDGLIKELDAALQFPGVSNAWTQPIKARIDMQATGIRTPLGIKVVGKNLEDIERAARDVEAVLKTVPGTGSAFGERVNGGYYLEIHPRLERMARYGLSISAVHDVIRAALGAETVTQTVEGRERYAVTIRYPRALRSDPTAIANEIQVALPSGGTVPLGEVADVRLARGPASIRTEDAKLATYVYIDVQGRDLASYVEEAKRALANRVTLPAGTHLVWSGQYEGMQRASARLERVVPLTLALIFLLLYLNFGRLTPSLIVMLSLPFALSGGIWLTWWLGINLSVAVGVGFIALAGVATETGIVMLHYLDRSHATALDACTREGRTLTAQDTEDAIMSGAVDRARPKMMTVVAIIAGLIPILWSTGTGSEVMQRIAVPMIGGMVTSSILTLIVIPALYAIVKLQTAVQDTVSEPIAGHPEPEMGSPIHLAPREIKQAQAA